MRFFFEDAVLVSKILNIALTHRGKIGVLPVPMAGIPHHAASAYLDKITDQGHKVAIAEQIESPKDAVGIVKRAVVQVISPAIPYDLDKSDATEHRFILAFSIENGRYFIVIMDFTTGDFLGMTTDNKEDFLEKIRLLSPKEIITYMGQFDPYPEINLLLKQYRISSTCLSKEYFNEKFTACYIEKLVPGYNRDEFLHLDAPILGPLGAISYYIFTTQKQDRYCHLRPFKMARNDQHMKISLPTLMGLEILPKDKLSYKNSLLGFLAKTSTLLGSRTLKDLLLHPLNDREEILKRQQMVCFFHEKSHELSDIRKSLSSIRDIERILAKISKGRATGNDVLCLSDSIDISLNLWEGLPSMPWNVLSPFSPEETASLKNLSRKIKETVNDGNSTSPKEHLIRCGLNKQRDRLAQLLENTSGCLDRLEEKYRQKTGIQKLKIRSNNITGYFIEIGKSHAHKAPADFKQRQTLVNALRYTTEELLDFEREILTAKDNLDQLENSLFNELIKNISHHSKEILKMASNVALTDCFTTFAWIAHQEEWTLPLFYNEKKVHLIHAWHPLIKDTLQDKFVPHDLRLDKECFLGLITGPNMAGKTTVMREVAIVQILAQMGSFVPAVKAELGPLRSYLLPTWGQ